MPVISFFLGIYIRMYYREHNPPHFHVEYKNDKAIININTLEVMEGELPRRVLALVLEWASYNREKLMENWHNIETGHALNKIKPLDEDDE